MTGATNQYGTVQDGLSATRAVHTSITQMQGAAYQDLLAVYLGSDPQRKQKDITSKANLIELT